MIETRNLTKNYKGFSALKNVSVTINKGKIYGLIGQNGAGKTTFIRMIAGLIFPSSGEIIINGKSDKKSLSIERKKMSFIVETPYYIPNLTAYENMEYQRISRGVSDSCSSSNKWLDFAGLGDTGNKKAGNFSLGMRQRLGIAMAMISEPEILFLDEPVNGLDPLGIIQMRDLINQMNTEFNTTVVISSHLLAELYQIASDYVFIDKGSVIDQFSKKHLDDECCDYIETVVNDVERSITILKNQFNIQNFEIDQENNSIKIYDDITTEAIAKSLVCNDISLRKIVKTSVSLEDFFVSRIQGKEV